MEAYDLIRLDRFLSNMGYGTRKQVKKLISAGTVTVNAIAAADCGRLIDENSDRVSVGENRVAYRPFIYLMLNKPAGVLSASADAAGCVTAADLVADKYAHYHVSPAGRLDKDSEGFLILTNDGEYIHRVISPSKHVEKQYLCRLVHEIKEEDIETFRTGVVLEDGYVCRPAALERADTAACTEDGPCVFVTIQEGKFHQVKRMFLARKNQVLSLKRLRIGGVFLDAALAPGEYREMTEEERKRIIYE